jgi:hypothetical protein
MSDRHCADEVSTDRLQVRDSRHHAHHRRGHPPMRSMRFLFIGVTVALVVVSVAVAWQMRHRSASNDLGPVALRGDCLIWQPGEPERATHVDCADEHLFEVADSEPIPPADADRQEICARAVGYYLGPRYDPGGRFVVGAVQAGERMLCGLQLPSDGVASFEFKGKVIDQDQSRVWPTGTCLGIRDGKTTDIAVECGLPHALEITGTADLSTVFDQAAPSTAAQDAVVRDMCGVATSAYLSPLILEETGLALRYQPIDAKGWEAGSRRVACRIGAPNPDGEWATLVRSAKNGVIIDGQKRVTMASPAEPAPAELPAPTSQPLPPEPEPSPPAETSQSVEDQTEESSGVEEPVPHIDGSAGLGPVPHMAGEAVPGPIPYVVGPQVPGPATESPSAQPLPDAAG